MKNRDDSPPETPDIVSLPNNGEKFVQEMQAMIDKAGFADKMKIEYGSNAEGKKQLSIKIDPRLHKNTAVLLQRLLMDQFDPDVPSHGIQVNGKDPVEWLDRLREAQDAQRESEEKKPPRAR